MVMPDSILPTMVTLSNAGDLALLRNHHSHVHGNWVQHHRAHFHAFYQEHAAVFALDTIECLSGCLPKAQQRLVEAWAEIHRAELQDDWALLQSGQPPVKIDPLR
jgi:hypothetical protein